ncbi:hypothetical protein EK21DRAFT_14836, partial [Setomelanomma holmii]
ATPSILKFVMSVVNKSQIGVPTLMTCLVYLNRVRSRTSSFLNFQPSCPHRIFLAALILAAKYVNDASPMNKRWARYSSMRAVPKLIFSLAEINRMEIDLLRLLDWDLRISIEDLYCQIRPLMPTVR